MLWVFATLYHTYTPVIRNPTQKARLTMLPAAVLHLRIYKYMYNHVFMTTTLRRVYIRVLIYTQMKDCCWQRSPQSLLCGAYELRLYMYNIIYTTNDVYIRTIQNTTNKGLLTSESMLLTCVYVYLCIRVGMYDFIYTHEGLLTSESTKPFVWGIQITFVCVSSHYYITRVYVYSYIEDINIIIITDTSIHE